MRSSRPPTAGRGPNCSRSTSPASRCWLPRRGRCRPLGGYRVRAASAAPQALASVEQEVPQLIVLDMNMPGMNGVEVLRKLRERKYAGGVILLTTGQDDKLLDEALDLGSVGGMGKPVDLG